MRADFISLGGALSDVWWSSIRCMGVLRQTYGGCSIGYMEGCSLCMGDAPSDVWGCSIRCMGVLYLMYGGFHQLYGRCFIRCMGVLHWMYGGCFVRHMGVLHQTSRGCSVRGLRVLHQMDQGAPSDIWGCSHQSDGGSSVRGPGMLHWEGRAGTGHHSWPSQPRDRGWWLLCTVCCTARPAALPSWELCLLSLPCCTGSSACCHCSVPCPCCLPSHPLQQLQMSPMSSRLGVG